MTFVAGTAIRALRSELLTGFTCSQVQDIATAVFLAEEVGGAFDAVERAAGNALQTSLYQALVTLHAASTSDLTSRSYPLPRMVTYTMGKTFSALALAQRLYGDASRAGALASENKVFNPAFMPLAGQALSA